MGPSSTFAKVPWRELSMEHRGFLLTLLEGSSLRSWPSLAEVALELQIDERRTQEFVTAAVSSGVLGVSENGVVHLLQQADTLHRSWERRFDDVFWPAVSAPWKKLGRANAFKVWSTKTYRLIQPRTEEGADALCERIMSGVARYKQLLQQPNAPAMKYPEGWLSAERWDDEIDATFISQHGRFTPEKAMNPLERARAHQNAQTNGGPPQRALAEERDELDIPQFTVSL